MNFANIPVLIQMAVDGDDDILEVIVSKDQSMISDYVTSAKQDIQRYTSECHTILEDVVRDFMSFDVTGHVRELLSESSDYIQDLIGNPADCPSNAIIREGNQIQRICAMTLVRNYDITSIVVISNEVTVGFKVPDGDSSVTFVTSDGVQPHVLQRIFMHDVREQIMTFLKNSKSKTMNQCFGIGSFICN